MAYSERRSDLLSDYTAPRAILAPVPGPEYADTMSAHSACPFATRLPLPRPAAGLGAIALNWLLVRKAKPCGKPAESEEPAGGQDAALRRQGQARHLPVHGRRAEPDGPVRPEAGAGEVARQAAARNRPAGPRASSPTATRPSCPARASSTKHGQSGIEMSRPDAAPRRRASTTSASCARAGAPTRSTPRRCTNCTAAAR